MPQTHFYAVAACTINGVGDIKKLLETTYESMLTHGGYKLSVSKWDSAESFIRETRPYVQLDDDKLTITLDTEDDLANDSNMYDLLASYFARQMTSDYMRVIWASYGLASGLSADCFLYDKDDKLVSIDTLVLNRD